MTVNRHRILLDWIDREQTTPDAFYQKHLQFVSTFRQGQSRHKNISLEVGYSWLAAGLCYEFGENIQGIIPNPSSAHIAYAMIIHVVSEDGQERMAWLDKMCSLGYQATNGKMRRPTHMMVSLEGHQLQEGGDVSESLKACEQGWLVWKDREDGDY
jgi:hypothetical protein